MNNIDKDIQIVSCKIVEAFFCNVYEILDIKKTNLHTKITFTTSLEKKNSSVIELLVGFKLIDSGEKEEVVLSLSNMSKFNIAKSKIKKIDKDKVELNEECLKKMLGTVLNTLTTHAKILLDICGFGSINIPLILDTEKIILNNK